MSAAPRLTHGLHAATAALVLASCSLVTGLDGYSGGSGAGPDAGSAADGAAADGGPSAGGFTDERLEGQFGAGTFAGTRWAGDHVELDVGKSAGDFLSRVFDAGSAGVSWQRLRWVPGAPYGKALPDNGAAETGYRASSFDMANNVLLVHFDGALVDTSPAANVLAGSALGFAPAVFGSGLQDTQAGYVHANVTSSASVFNFGTDSFSWSIWAKSTTPCPGNAVYMGIENPGTGLKPHLWLGCTPLGGDAGAPGTLGDTFCSTRGTTNDCASVDGSQVLTDGAWHHMAIVKDGHAPATLSAYLDGVLQGTTPADYLNPIVFDDGVEFAIGGFSKGTYPADGVFDEVAVWRRALTAAEVVALYRRGAQRLSVQVRACAEPTCDNVAFVGPSSDPARSFVDPPNNLTPPDALPIAASGRYVQYKVHFESDDASQSPALYAVTVGQAP
jgi:hypothetical protein